MPARGWTKKTAARLSDLFEGRIGAVLAAARDPARRKQLEAAEALAKAAAASDNYAASVLLAGYEKDKAGASALLRDFCAYGAAGLAGSSVTPLQGEKAAQAIQAAGEAVWQLGPPGECENCIAGVGCQIVTTMRRAPGQTLAVR